MSLETNGVWQSGVWATTVWADGVWREGAYIPPEPAPEVTVQGGGGGRKRKVRLISSTEKIRREAQKTQEAVKVIARLKSERIEPALIDEAEKVASRLKESIAVLEDEVTAIQERLAKKAEFADFSAKMHAQKYAREMQLLMVQAQVQAEYARQQMEELDIVFITFMLVASL